MDRANWKLGLGLSLTTAVMWGLLPIALKGLLEAMDPVTITWYRFAVSAVATLLLFGRGQRMALRKLLSRQYRAVTAVVVACLLANYLLYLLGLHAITPGAAQMVIQLAPLLLLLGSIVVFSERLSVGQSLGLMMLVAGLLLFFHHRLLGAVGTDGDYLWGLVLVAMAALAWAGYGLGQKYLLRTAGSNSILLMVYLAGIVCFLPFSEPGRMWSLQVWELGLLLFVGLNTFVAYSSFGMAIAFWDVSRVSAVIALSPLLTLCFVSLLEFRFPAALVSEPLDALAWAGALCVVAGSVMVALTGAGRSRGSGS